MQDGLIVCPSRWEVHTASGRKPSTSSRLNYHATLVSTLGDSFSSPARCSWTGRLTEQSRAPAERDHAERHWLPGNICKDRIPRKPRGEKERTRSFGIEENRGHRRKWICCSVGNICSKFRTLDSFKGSYPLKAYRYCQHNTTLLANSTFIVSIGHCYKCPTLQILRWF